MLLKCVIFDANDTAPVNEVWSIRMQIGATACVVNLLWRDRGKGN